MLDLEATLEEGNLVFGKQDAPLLLAQRIGIVIVLVI